MMKDENDKQFKSRTPRLIWPVLGLFIALGLFLVVSNILQKERTFPPPTVTDTGISVKPSQTTEDIVRLYREQVSPLIDDSEKRNRLAVERTINSIHEKFLEYRRGIEPFVEDISGWGTRFGIAGRTAGDLWDKYWKKKENPERVKEYVDSKFNTMIVSDKKLENDLRDILSQFQSDLAAERNRLFSEMKLALTTSSAPIVFDDKGFKKFLDDVNARTSKVASQMTKDAVILGLAAFGAGAVAGEVMQRLVQTILTQAASSLAVTMLAGSTATASTVVAGGGIGSTGGPVGTVVGVGVGLIVGMVVDWWATGKLEEKLKDQCSQFLINVETGIVKGNESSPGLRTTLEEAIRINSQAQRKAILDALQGGSV